MILKRINLVIALLGVSTVLLAADNPFVGLWKFDLAKSKITRGQPPKSRTLLLEAFGADGIKSTTDTVNPTGPAGHEVFGAKFDGKDYEITGTDPRQVFLKRIDTNTIEAKYKRGGKITSTSRFVVSKDGTTLTVSSEGVSGDGQPYKGDVRVYHK